jgi:hypothetical protein
MTRLSNLALDRLCQRDSLAEAIALLTACPEI